jgi:hypothetical protein
MTRAERRVLRKRLRYSNALRDHLRDIRQRGVVTIALAMATCFSLVDFARDGHSGASSLAFVVLFSLFVIVGLATAASYYAYRRFLIQRQGDGDDA